MKRRWTRSAAEPPATAPAWPMPSSGARTWAACTIAWSGSIESKRSSILYAYVDGCSHAEIAARMQSPLGTIKAWIKRGLNALKECMG